MKMQAMLSAALLAAALSSSPSLSAAEHATSTSGHGNSAARVALPDRAQIGVSMQQFLIPQEQAQIGVLIKQFLLCVQDGHESGYPWSFTFQLCVDVATPAGRSRPAAASIHLRRD